MENMNSHPRIHEKTLGSNYEHWVCAERECNYGDDWFKKYCGYITKTRINDAVTAGCASFRKATVLRNYKTFVWYKFCYLILVLFATDGHFRLYC